MTEASKRSDAGPSETEPAVDPWQTALEGLDLILLDPAACRLHGDGLGRLWGTVNGRDYPDLLAHMPFPLSSPRAWISLVAVEDADSDGRRSDGGQSDRVELGVLPGVGDLDSESKAALASALRLRYFLPLVVRIVHVRDEDPGQSGAVVWELLTDRGPMRLRMPNLFDGIQQQPDGRLLLADRDGNRVDIPSVAALDLESRKWLERYYWF